MVIKTTYEELEQRIKELEKEVVQLKQEREEKEIQAEKIIEKAHDELEMRVKERTAELGRVIEQLKLEIKGRSRFLDTVIHPRSE